MFQMLIPINSASLMKFGENIQGILDQVRYLIVSIPDLCHLSYFGEFCKNFIIFLRPGADGSFS